MGGLNVQTLAKYEYDYQEAIKPIEEYMLQHGLSTCMLVLLEHRVHGYIDELVSSRSDR